jgi:UDP-N-acetyl-2-amino-2-deoxyglucuronate dehydrogenase
MNEPLPAIQGRKIRFALVGCGRISRNHINAVTQHVHAAELVSVCDADAFGN